MTKIGRGRYPVPRNCLWGNVNRINCTCRLPGKTKMVKNLYSQDKLPELVKSIYKNMGKKKLLSLSEPKYQSTQVLNQIIYYWMVFLSFPCFIKFDCGATTSVLRLNEDKKDNGHKNSACCNWKEEFIFHPFAPKAPVTAHADPHSFYPL